MVKVQDSGYSRQRMSTKKYFRNSISILLRLFNLCVILTLTIYFSQIQEGQLAEFQSRFLFLRSIRQSTILVLGGIISYILRNKYDSSLNTVYRAISRITVNPFITIEQFICYGWRNTFNNVEFFISKETQTKHKLVTDSFLFSDSSNADCLSLYIILKYTPLDETHLAVVTGLIH